MTCRKKPRLDFQLDIISELIVRQLAHIIEDIFSHLNEIDLANAIAANPKWSAIITSKTRLKRLISRNNGKCAPLKILYRKEELLARETPDPIDVSSLFVKACTNYSNLAKSRVDPMKEQEDFRIVFPLDRTFFWKFSTIHVTDRFVVTLLKGSTTKSIIGSRSRIYYHLVQLFDRWTFELVNSMTVYCNDLELQFVENGVNAALINFKLKEDRRALMWDLTTGTVLELPSPAPICQSLCFGKLVVLVWRDGEELFATVFKVRTDGERISVTCIADDAGPLDAFHCAWEIPGPEDIDCFAIYAYTAHSGPDIVFQLRSKEDFTLLRAVSLRGPSRITNSFLMSEWFTFVVNEEPDLNDCSSVDVVSLHESFRTVYRFKIPDELDRAIDASKGNVATVGAFLILYSEYDAELNAAIWKLPSDFVETCQRHFNERTVGVTSKCDQLIIEKGIEKREEMIDHEAHGRFDRFGVLKCSVYSEARWLETPAVVHVSMLNSIISDEGSV